MNKVNEIKLSLTQFKEHFKEEVDHAIADPAGEEAVPISVDKKRQSLGQLEKKSKLIVGYLPKVQELEVDLGLPDDVKDQELTTIETTLQKEITDAKQAIRGQQIREAKEEQAKEARAAPKTDDRIVPPNE